MLGGQVAGELLGEVLDHVVAFGLAVYQDVDAGLLLEGQDLPDLGPDAVLVAGGVDVPGSQVGAGRTQFGGLRERSDRGRRKQRETQVRPLGGGPLRVRLGAPPVRVGDGGGAGPDRRIVGEGGAGAGGQVGPVGGEFGGDGLRAAGQAPGEDGDLRGLLAGEGEPAPDLRVDVPFDGGVQRHVEQGAGGGHVHPVGEPQEGAEGARDFS